uniref:Endoplasmic reticulum junction formation protein lunapark n=1 Tax=Lutzomyia longipalpis TaxID=7200 RepID=A0A1B0CWJ4_LUTLO
MIEMNHFPKYCIFTVRWMLNWYYDRKLNKKSDELYSLRDKKRQTLEMVMNNEPYKAALQILDRFSEKHATPSYSKSPVSTPVAIPKTAEKRMVLQSETPHIRNVNYVSPYRPQTAIQNMTPTRSSKLPGTPATPALTPAPVARATTPRTSTSGRPLPFPLIDWRERNMMERMKKESSYQQLEKLEKKISEIENYSIETQKRQKRLVGNFIVGSFGIFIVCFGVFYFFFFPETWTERILYSWPLLCFPIVIFTVRWMLNWYYDRKLNKKSDELYSLRDKKRQTLEMVMNNEPYKAALQILDRFSEKHATPSYSKSPVSTPVAIPKTAEKRMVLQSETPHIRNVNYVSPYRPQTAIQNMTPTRSSKLPATPATPALTPAPVARATTPRTSTSGRPLPFPLIDWRERNMMERMVDYLVGDGPSSRYAMICKNCFKHNG